MIVRIFRRLLLSVICRKEVTDSYERSKDTEEAVCFLLYHRASRTHANQHVCYADDQRGEHQEG